MSTALTDLESRALSGDDEAVEEFEALDDVIVIDWRGTEFESLEAIAEAIPSQDFDFAIQDHADRLGLRVEFRGRTLTKDYVQEALNNFRVILDASELLAGDFEIRAFRSSARDDTNALLLRSSAWWSEAEERYPKGVKKLFCTLPEMRRYWGLQPSPAKLESPTGKPWWKFWG